MEAGLFGAEGAGLDAPELEVACGPGLDPKPGLGVGGGGVVTEVTPAGTPLATAAAANMTKLTQFDGIQTVSLRLSSSKSGLS